MYIIGILKSSKNLKVSSSLYPKLRISGLRPTKIFSGAEWLYAESFTIDIHIFLTFTFFAQYLLPFQYRQVSNIQRCNTTYYFLNANFISIVITFAFIEPCGVISTEDADILQVNMGILGHWSCARMNLFKPETASIGLTGQKCVI